MPDKSRIKKWVTENLITFAITILTVGIIAYIYSIMEWDFGFTALALIIWGDVKAVWKDE